jgi:hypothetical protein
MQGIDFQSQHGTQASSALLHQVDLRPQARMPFAQVSEEDVRRCGPWMLPYHPGIAVSPQYPFVRKQLQKTNKQSPVLCRNP